MTEFVMISVPVWFQFYYYIIECIQLIRVNGLFCLIFIFKPRVNLKYNFKGPQQGEFG